VYSRLFGIKNPIDSTKGRKEIFETAVELLPHKNPGTYNQAVMELGAMVCLPAKPNCENCPIQDACYAFAHKKVADFPVKQGKIKQRSRYFHYLVITHAGKILIRLRKGKDIWQGLHDFPMVETQLAMTPAVFVKDKKWKEIIAITKPIIKDVSNEYMHVLSHQKLYARFYNIIVDKETRGIPSDCFWVKVNDLENYAIPRLIDIYIRKKIYSPPTPSLLLREAGGE
jgi:A/G-specific adenine glycosylase